MIDNKNQENLGSQGCCKIPKRIGNGRNLFSVPHKIESIL